MKKRTKVKDKSFILDKRKDPEGYSGSFCGFLGALELLTLNQGQFVGKKLLKLNTQVESREF